MSGTRSYLLNSYNGRLGPVTPSKSNRGAAGQLANPSVAGYASHPYTLFGPVFDAVDAVAELRGAGVIVQFDNKHSQRLRPSNHESELETFVVLRPEAAISAAEIRGDNRSWWDRHSEVVMSCGGASLAWASVGISAAAEGITLGASTIPMFLSYGAATGSSVQCAVAVKKELDPGFAQYLESDEGRWYNAVDIILDVISMADGVNSVRELVKAGKIWKDGKIVGELNEVSKGKLLKLVDRLEKNGEDLTYFRQTVEEFTKKGKISDPAGRGISNNILKRALPYLTRQIALKKLATIAKAISTVAAAVSSQQGGPGSMRFGVIRFTVRILQERIDGLDR